MQNFEILKAALKIQVFWDTMLYQLVPVRGACCLHLRLFLDHLDLKGRQQIHPKHPVYQLTLRHIPEDFNLQCGVAFGAFCLELLLYC